MDKLGGGQLADLEKLKYGQPRQGDALTGVFEGRGEVIYHYRKL